MGGFKRPLLACFNFGIIVYACYAIVCIIYLESDFSEVFYPITVNIVP